MKMPLLLNTRTAPKKTAAIANSALAKRGRNSSSFLLKRFDEEIEQLCLTGEWVNR